MVMRFTATVKKRQIVVRNVDLPDGSEVQVTIDEDPIEEELILTPEQERELDESLAAADRGERGVSLDVVLAELERQREVYRRVHGLGPKGDRPRGQAVERPARGRAKSARRRARGG